MPNNINCKIPWIPVLLIVIAGCDERVAEVAREAANRQAQQNTAMAELNKEVATGTRRLVDADAAARKEIVGVHRELQAERSRLDTGWLALHDERRQIAGERRTESLLAPLMTLIGGILLVAMLLGFCWYALAAAREDDADAELNELLITEILPEERPPLLGYSQPRSLLSQPKRMEE